MQKNILLNFEQMTSEQASQPAHLMLVRIEMSRTAATAQSSYGRICRRIHFAHVFEKYDKFAARKHVLCTRVREIQRICSQEARTLHTCSRNTTISLLALNF